MNEKEKQEQARKLVAVHIIESINNTIGKAIEENPSILNEAKNYYPINDEGEKDEENGEYPEIYEFWSVSGWIADRLEAKGEIIFDYLDFIVWGRQCTGQAIYMDEVIQDIAEDTKVHL